MIAGGDAGAAGVLGLLLIALAALLVPSHFLWVHRVRRSMSPGGRPWPTRLLLLALAAATPVAGFYAVTLARRDWVRTGGWRRLWPVVGLAVSAVLQIRQEARYVDAFDHPGRLLSLLAQGLVAYAILFAIPYMAAHVLLGSRRPPWESGAHGGVLALLAMIGLAPG